jgi:hypothetical protein
VLGEGDRLPDVVIFAEDATPVTLPELAVGGPLLLSFYLYDWTRT